MYSNKFVTCVISNGHILKELNNGIVPIAFDSEFSLRFRNKHSRRAAVKFWIDEEDVSGSGYVISANSYIDIERYADKNVKFKFVSLNSEEAIDFGKNDNKDGNKGLIRVRFYLEKEYLKSINVDSPFNKINNNYWNNSPIFGNKDVTQPSTDFKLTYDQSLYYDQSLTYNTSLSFNNAYNNYSDLQEGATVEGSYSNQSFYKVHIDLEENYVEMKLILKGFKPEENSQNFASNVKFCSKCGKEAKLEDNYCTKCGNKF